MTRWFFIRHAPVTENKGALYGQSDLNCDCTDTAAFDRLREQLDRHQLSCAPVVLTSGLKRTVQTYHALQGAEHWRGTEPWAPPTAQAALNEQDFGQWEGQHYNTLNQRSPQNFARFWGNPAAESPPEGESFTTVCARVGAFVHAYTQQHERQDILCFCHGGTVRAALVQALSLCPAQALQFKVEPLSLTLLEAHTTEDAISWAVSRVNLG